jgi:hypothetical protein
MSHTKEPWACRVSPNKARGAELISSAGHEIGQGDYDGNVFFTEDDARRIVDCVNAMKGIPNGNALFLKDNGVRKHLVRIETERLKVVAERDALLAEREQLLEALKDASSAIYNLPHTSAMEDIVDGIAILKKATSSTPAQFQPVAARCLALMYPLHFKVLLHQEMHHLTLRRHPLLMTQ